MKWGKLFYRYSLLRQNAKVRELSETAPEGSTLEGTCGQLP